MSNEMKSEVPLRVQKGQVLCYHEASSRTKSVPGTYSGAQECSPPEKVSRKIPSWSAKGPGWDRGPSFPSHSVAKYT